MSDNSIIQKMKPFVFNYQFPFRLHSNKKKSVLLLDYDGTIDNNADKYKNFKEAICTKLNLRIPWTSLLEFKESLGGGWDTEMAKLGVDWRGEHKDLVYETLNEEYLSKPAKLIPGITEIIKAYSPEQLGIISGSHSDYIRKSLQENNLKNQFKHIFGVEECAKGKPHPDALFKMMELYGVSEDKTLYVGDTVDDIQFAKNAGVESLALALDTSWHPKEMLINAKPDYIADSMIQLGLLIYSLMEPLSDKAQ